MVTNPENLLNTKSAVIAIVGAPNAGKSTILNALVGSKVAIVTPKVQTTRTAIRGISVVGKTQLVFVDTPGIFNPKRTLEKNIVKMAWQSLAEVDEVALVIDAKKGLTDDIKQIIAELGKRQIKAIIILNKVDLVTKEKLLPLAQELSSLTTFKELYMISALKNEGIAELKNYFCSLATDGPWFYSEDQISDAPIRFMAAEITREKLFLRLNQELPYSIAVETETYEEQKNGSVKISQVIYTMKPGQKKIILGQKGAMIKEVGQAARLELQKFLGCKVHLYLFVKVRENWVGQKEIYQFS